MQFTPDILLAAEVIRDVPPSLWVTVLGGGGFVAVLGFLRWLLPFFRNIWARRNESKIILSREKVQTIYNELTSLATDKLSTRSAVFVGHNCGGLPDSGRPFYTSILYYHDAFPGEKDIELSRYTNVVVDQAYNTLILDIHENGYQVIKTKEMIPSQLKNYYEAEGVTESVVVFLKVKHKELFYMSMARYEEDDISDYTQAEVTEMLLRAGTIRNSL